MKQIMLAASLCLCSHGAWAACAHSRIIEHVFPAEAFDAVTLNALAGDLDVEGDGDDRIVFRGEACTDRPENLDRMALDIEDSGSTLELTVVIPYKDRDFKARYATMDVELTLPRTLPLTLNDSSGDIFSRDATVVEVDDSSGNIRIVDSAADLDIEDSSGDIDLRQIGGHVSLRDSSGDISIRGVQGDVIIPSDSSGDIEVETVDGSVTVARDGSGSIEIDDVGKDVVIENDGSGDIDIRHVRGNARIGSDGSGSVDVSQIEGDFEFHAKGSGDIRVRDVAGRVRTPR